MTGNVQNNSPDSRFTIAIFVLIVAFIAILALAIVAIYNNRENAYNILNSILPMLGTWVGTVLAFYFGRENFESASTQIREMAGKLTPEEKAKLPVTDIMMKADDVTHHMIEDGKSDKDYKLSSLRSKYSNIITRLPIVNPNKSPKYVIHASAIDNYLSTGKGHSEDDSLEDFIKDRKEANIEFGLNQAFIVVSTMTTIAEAKIRMDQIRFCQDILITRDGRVDQPISGWISNIRLAERLKA